MTFNVGDTVQLKSGSALMTVESYDTAKQRYTCVWHDRNEAKRDEYPEAVLQAATRPKGGIAIGRR
jgi:uncharacterized protein YodC (DUF2158 family)